MSNPHEHAGHEASGANWSRINQWVLWIGLAAAVAWLFFRHNAHLAQLLPFLIVLACPLMHLFGHGRHGRHRSHGETRPKDNATRQLPPGEQSGHQH